MKKLFLLAIANIRRAKTQMAILVLIFLIAATLLNVGLAMLFGFNNHFDKLAEQLNASDVHIILSEHLLSDELYRMLIEETTEFAVHRALHFTVGFPDASEHGEAPVFQSAAIYDVNEERELSRWKLVGDSLPMTERGVYLSYLLYTQRGYALGQEITLELDGTAFSFVVEGFIEPIWMDHLGWLATMIVDSGRFAEISEQFPRARAGAIFANGIDNFRNFVMNVSETAGTPGTVTLHVADEIIAPVTSLELIRAGRTMNSLIFSAMMIAFTFIIVIVSLFVIRFRIKNTIEEDMQKIGSLQAIGYTNSQIRASNCLQFGMLSAFPAIIGIVPAFFILPAIGRAFAPLSGMLWEPGFTPLINIGVILGLMPFVQIVTLLATRPIKKITPVRALRHGISTHSFKRNPIPLDKSRLPLTLCLSLKSVIFGTRQTVMILLIILSVSFSAVFALIMFYNAAIDISTFEQVPGIERSNSVIIFNPGQDTEALLEEVLAHEWVRDAQFSDVGNFTLEGMPIRAEVMEDFDRRVTRNIFDGIFPRYENEIAVSMALASELNLRIGGEVHAGTQEVSFLITGITHALAADAYLTFDGLERIFPGTEKLRLMIYLYPGTNAALFTEEIEKQMGGRALIVLDADAEFAAAIDPFASIFAMLGLVILILAAIIIVLILHFVLGAVIIRRHRDFGIQKAIGFTTLSLMNQLSLAFSFPILLGAAIGTTLGIFLSNPLVATIMRPMGLMPNFIVNIPWAISAGIIITLLAYCISMLTTRRIRKISAYRLVTE